MTIRFVFLCSLVVLLFVCLSRKGGLGPPFICTSEGGRGGDMIHGHAVWEACGMVFEEDGRGDGPRV